MDFTTNYMQTFYSSVLFFFEREIKLKQACEESSKTQVRYKH